MKGQPEQALVHDSIEPSELWHRRLAHVHYRALPMARKVVSKLPEIHTKYEGICKGCAQGKNAKKTFPSSESKAKGILDIVHSDVCGPMSSISLSGYVYYVSFIDDFSCKTWIYLLKGEIKYSVSSRNIKPSSRTKLIRRSRLYGQLMV